MTSAMNRTAYIVDGQYHDALNSLREEVCDEADVIAFKVRRFINVVDHENSKIEWFPRPKKYAEHARIAHSITAFSFFGAPVDGVPIFRIPELPLSFTCFVTEPFIAAVESHGLTGFHFDVVREAQ